MNNYIYLDDDDVEIINNDKNYWNYWTKFNNDYKISLNNYNDCIQFINNNFNQNISDLFIELKKNNYNSDFWKLCKLYINGGVYTNLNLISNFEIDKLDKNISFYFCLSIYNRTILNNFLINFSKEKDPLLLVLLLSFLINEPYFPNSQLFNPSIDIYDCLKYLLDTDVIKPEQKYELDSVKLKINIGTSKDNIKKINLHYFPQDIKYDIHLHKNPYNDNFSFVIKDNYLIIKRLDENTGWCCDHIIDIIFKSKTSLYFFREQNDCNNNSYICNNNNKIFYYDKKNYINKTIYMTYKKNIPLKVKNRWLNLNIDYKIDFSLDDDCINFLNKNFNSEISSLFRSIPKGMYKADLWRLCKLYINSGVYADVDLVPYFNINNLDQSITFYSCISIFRMSIFQALMINFSKPKNPLFILLLLSFLINKAYQKDPSGPTFDMYSCIKYMLNVDRIIPDHKYIIDKIKLKIKIGSSQSNIKKINLFFFPNDIKYQINLHKNQYNDKFKFEINDNYLIIKRLDTDTGWDYNHSIDIVINSQTSFYFFKEKYSKHKKDWRYCYVTHKKKKILDSRDLKYLKGKDKNKKGW